MASPAKTLNRAADDEALPDPKSASRPTHFAFDHAVFSVKEAWFGLSPVSGEACYNVPLGDVRASLPIDTVVASFGIAKTSTDVKLLQVVKDSLKFVKEIRPGDSVPSEVLDGTASWKVEPYHRDLARARISMQLVSWMTGTHMDQVDSAELEQIAAMPDTKKKVQEALDAMAEKLGLTGENKKDVVNRFEDLARELSYIEALRERFGKIQKVYASFNTLATVYKREKSILEEVMRIRILMKKPVEQIAETFDQVDANTGEIMNTMKKFAATIRYVREMRDNLHQSFMRWDNLIEQWSGVALEPSAVIERLIRVTYQFVARHFPQSSDWSLQNR